jgi:hypothetical protein
LGFGIAIGLYLLGWLLLAFYLLQREGFLHQQDGISSRMG